MPERPQPSIGEQLAKLLDETEISQRELGRRLAGNPKSPNFTKRWDAQTRWVQKVLGPEVDRPTDAKLDRVEQAAGRPGFFSRPARRSQRARADELALLHRRLEEVEARSAQDVLLLREDLRKAIRRIRTLERRFAGGSRPASEAGQP